MWTYEIILKALEEGELRVDVQFTDGKSTFVRTYRPEDLDSLKRGISAQLTRIDRHETTLAAIPQSKTIDLTLSEPVETPVVVGPAPGEHV